MTEKTGAEETRKRARDFMPLDGDVRLDDFEAVATDLEALASRIAILEQGNPFPRPDVGPGGNAGAGSDYHASPAPPDLDTLARDIAKWIALAPREPGVGVSQQHMTEIIRAALAPAPVCHSDVEPEPCEPLRAIKEKLIEARRSVQLDYPNDALERLAEAEDLLTSMEETVALRDRTR